MPDLAVQPSINDVRGKALNAVFRRMQALDLTPLLVYRIDSAPASALPFLAWQFDISSPFWQLLVPGAGVPQIDAADQPYLLSGVTSISAVGALTSIAPLTEGAGGSLILAASEQVQRQLLRLAIALHRRRGTPWAIKTALTNLGWPNAAFLEGQASWGGTAYPASQGWAVCRIQIPLAAAQGVNLGTAVAPIIAAFNFFKRESVWLDGVWFTMPAQSDSLAPMLDLGLSGEMLNELLADIEPRMAEAGFAMEYPTPFSDAWSRVPVADGTYRAGGGLLGNGNPVDVVDEGVVANGVSYGVGLA